MSRPTTRGPDLQRSYRFGMDDRFNAHLGPGRGAPRSTGKPPRDNDVGLAFSDDANAAIRDWCSSNLTSEKSCGGVVLYRHGGLRVEGRAYSDPGVALGQAGARRTRCHRQGIEATALLVDAYGLSTDYWHVNVEIRTRCGRALHGHTWKTAEYPAPLLPNGLSTR